MQNFNLQESRTTKRSRRLSASEKVFAALDRAYPPFINQFVLEGAGSFNRDRWLSAVENASRANPGSRLVLRGKLGWSRLVDTGRTPPVRILNVETWSGKSSEGADFLRDPLPLYSGPTCEVLLLPGDPARVIFRTHHTVMDGGGTLLWVKDVFRALNGEQLQGSMLGITDTQLAKSLNGGSHINWSRIYPAPTGEVEDGNAGIVWRRIQIPGRHSMLLSKVALFVAQKARKSPKETIHIAIPVDMRKHAAVPANTGNLTGFIHIMVSEQSTPEEITQQIRTKLEQREYAALSPGVTVGVHIPIGLFVIGVKSTEAKMRQDALFGDSAILSNLGKLDLDVFSTGDFRPHSGFFIPPGTGISPLFMALAGSENGTNLVAAMPAGLATRGRIDQLMFELERFLN